jgi:hypothetical protein
MVAAVIVTGAGLLAVIAGLLAVPVEVVIDAERGEGLSVRWQVTWLFGLLRLASTKASTPFSLPQPVKGRARSSRKGRNTGDRAGLAALRARGFVRLVVRLVMALIRQVKLERFHAEAAFGFENPADTGFVYGCLSPALMAAGTRGLDLRCTPMFWERGVRGSLGITTQVRPLFIMGTVVVFLVSPPVFRAARAAWRARA